MPQHRCLWGPNAEGCSAQAPAPPWLWGSVPAGQLRPPLQPCLSDAARLAGTALPPWGAAFGGRGCWGGHPHGDLALLRPQVHLVAVVVRERLRRQGPEAGARHAVPRMRMRQHPLLHLCAHAQESCSGCGCNMRHQLLGRTLRRKEEILCSC